MGRILLLLLLLASSLPAFARLADTVEQAEDRYGLEKPQPSHLRTESLVATGRDRTFEFQGWKIRCAFLVATDGKEYVVREEYRRILNAEIMKQGGSYQIRDFERDAILTAETRREPWSKTPPLNFDSSWKIPLSGSIWYGSDGAVARLSLGADAMTLDLPQARQRDAELSQSKDQRARAQAARLAATSTGSSATPPALAEAPIAPLPSADRTPRPVATVPYPPARPSTPTAVQLPAKPAAIPQFGIPNLWLLAVLAGGLSGLKVLLSSRSGRRSRREAKPRLKGRTLPPPPPSPAPAPVVDRPKSFEDLDWEEFELLVGEIFRRQGYHIHLCRATGADGGIDLTLSRDDEKVLVQCKNWSAAKVSAREVREFYGVLISESATRGIFVTAGEFTRDALDFGTGKPLEMINGKALEHLVRTARNDPGDDLLTVRLWAPLFARSVSLIEPMCPFCRAKMVLRHGAGGHFWGCTKFPRCRGQRGVRRYLESEVTV